MKKILFISFALSFAFVANAQVRTMKSATYGLSLDTVTTTTPHYMQLGPISMKSKNIEIVAKVLEISGTTSGSVSIEASFDGSVWFSPFNSTDTTYALTLSDVATAQTYRWKLEGQRATYWRIKAAGGGSVSFTISGTLVTD